MSNSILFHSLTISGFDHLRWDWSGKHLATELIRRKPGSFECPVCHSRDVTATPVGHRLVKASKIGRDNWILNVETHRIRCHDCAAYRMESLPFLSDPKSRITRGLERTILELRPEMSISALSKYYDLDWRTVKEVEKKSLARKYKSVPLVNARIIGMDEIYVGKKKYKTIVRDLETGAVLHVGDGKGDDALTEFKKRLDRSKAKVEVVAMDMSSGYASWVRNSLGEAVIVFDHFHVIKLMNEKVEKIRRRTASTLEEKDLAALKKKRFLVLRNQEDLDAEEMENLAVIRESYHDLGAASVLKEKLRNVYNLATDFCEAEWMLADWCAEADASGVRELRTMAKTIRAHTEGILAFWTTGGVTLAAVEGFKNKN